VVDPIELAAFQMHGGGCLAGPGTHATSSAGETLRNPARRG
jgi:hypothetical protein